MAPQRSGLYKDPAVFLPPIDALLSDAVLEGRTHMHLLKRGIVWKESLIDNELRIWQWRTAQYDTGPDVYYRCNHYYCRKLWVDLRKLAKERAPLTVLREQTPDGYVPCLEEHVNTEFSSKQSTSELVDYVNSRLGGRSVQRLQLSAKRQNRLHELNNLFSIPIVKA